MKINKILENKVAYLSEQNLGNIEFAHLFVLLYRLLTFDSQIYTLLHGSVAVTPNGNAILLGDGVDCLGKTMTSIMVGKSSGKYMVDECALYNQATGSVYGNKNIPVHIRPNMIDKIERVFDLKMDNDKKFGAFILPEELGFEILETAKLKAIVSPKIVGEIKLEEEVNPMIKARKVAITANAHHLKMLNSNLDRVDGKKDKGEKIELVDHTVGYSAPPSLIRLPYYDAYLKESEDIVKLLEKEGL